MSVPSLRLPHRPTARPAALRAGPRLLAAGVLLVSCLCPGRPVADEPGDRAAYRDLRHTMLARAALLKDPVLAPLNLGVRVQNHVAVLWGPVPTAALKERAEQVLRRVPELLRVRNELHVQEPQEVAPQYLPEHLPPAAVAPGVRWRDALPARRSSALDFTSPAENVRLKPALPGPAADDDGADVTALPLDQAISQVQRREARFQGLRAEVRGSRVHLSGTAARWQDVYDLAAALTRLPGVERVILEQIRTATDPR
jgi:hypothetical protein